MSDIVPSFTELQRMHAEAERMRGEAAEMLKQAEAKDRDGEYKLGQADWRLREIQALEKSMSAREQKLKELNEPEFLARVAAADKALAEAKELMARYNRDKHAAAIYLRQCSERERKQSAA